MTPPAFTTTSFRRWRPATPPPLAPIPPFRYDEPVEPARLNGAEAAVLACVNGVLTAIGQPALARAGPRGA